MLEIVFGLEGLKRSRDYRQYFDAFADDGGELELDDSFDPAGAEEQQFIVAACDALDAEAERALAGEEVDLSIAKVDQCVYRELRDKVVEWPITPRERFLEELESYLRSKMWKREQFGLVEVATPGGATRQELRWAMARIRTRMTSYTSTKDVLREKERWDEWVDAFNAAQAPEGRTWVRHSAEVWVTAVTEDEAVKGTTAAIIVAAACAFGAIVAFTGDVVVSMLAIVTLGASVSCVVGTLFLLGWELGIVEAISLTVLVGLACDFCLHIAEAFSQSSAGTAEERVVEALEHIATPITSAGVSTVLGAFPLLFCTVQVLVRFGAIIPICMSFSLLFGVHLFGPLLMLFGPDGKPALAMFLGTRARRAAVLYTLTVVALFAVPSSRGVLSESAGLGMLVGAVGALVFIAGVREAYQDTPTPEDDTGVLMVGEAPSAPPAPTVELALVSGDARVDENMFASDQLQRARDSFNHRFTRA